MYRFSEVSRQKAPKEEEGLLSRLSLALEQVNSAGPQFLSQAGQTAQTPSALQIHQESHTGDVLETSWKLQHL